MKMSGALSVTPVGLSVRIRASILLFKTIYLVSLTKNRGIVEPPVVVVVVVFGVVVFFFVFFLCFFFWGGGGLGGRREGYFSNYICEKYIAIQK